MNNNVIATILALTLGCMSCSAPTEMTTEVMLVSTKPADLLETAPQTLPGNFDLILEEEQSITFFDLAGQVHTIDGPFNGEIRSKVNLPEATDAGARMLESTREFLRPENSSQRQLAATRSDSSFSVWELSTDSFSDIEVFCVPKNGEVMLSRSVSGFDSGIMMKLLPEGRETLFFKFEPNVSTIEVTSTELPDGEYMASIDDDLLGQVTIKSIDQPATSALPLELYSNGCFGQFYQTISSYP